MKDLTHSFTNPITPKFVFGANLFVFGMAEGFPHIHSLIPLLHRNLCLGQICLFLVRQKDFLTDLFIGLSDIYGTNLNLMEWSRWHYANIPQAMQSHAVVLVAKTWWLRGMVSLSAHPCPNFSSTLRLTHWGGDKMAAISQTMFSKAFYWMTMCEFCLWFHWSLFLRVQLKIFH